MKILLSIGFRRGILLDYSPELIEILEDAILCEYTESSEDNSLFEVRTEERTPKINLIKDLDINHEKNFTEVELRYSIDTLEKRLEGYKSQLLKLK
jgi:hypothetical protein